MAHRRAQLLAEGSRDNIRVRYERIQIGTPILGSPDSPDRVRRLGELVSSLAANRTAVRPRRDALLPRPRHRRSARPPPSGRGLGEHRPHRHRWRDSSRGRNAPIGAVLLSGPPTLTAGLAQAFTARTDDGHVLFDGGGAFLQPNGSSEATIVGVEILVSDMEKAERVLGDIDPLGAAVDANHRLHGLSLWLRSA